MKRDGKHLCIQICLKIALTTTTTTKEGKENEKVKSNVEEKISVGRHRCSQNEKKKMKKGFPNIKLLFVCSKLRKGRENILFCCWSYAGDGKPRAFPQWMNGARRNVFEAKKVSLHSHPCVFCVLKTPSFSLSILMLWHNNKSFLFSIFTSTLHPTSSQPMASFDKFLTRLDFDKIEHKCNMLSFCVCMNLS